MRINNLWLQIYMLLIMISSNQRYLLILFSMYIVTKEWLINLRAAQIFEYFCAFQSVFTYCRHNMFCTFFIFLQCLLTANILQFLWLSCKLVMKRPDCCLRSSINNQRITKSYKLKCDDSENVGWDHPYPAISNHFTPSTASRLELSKIMRLIFGIWILGLLCSSNITLNPYWSLCHWHCSDVCLCH